MKRRNIPPVIPGFHPHRNRMPSPRNLLAVHGRSERVILQIPRMDGKHVFSCRSKVRAYAKDGNVVCFFQSGKKPKTHNATLGFSGEASLEDRRHLAERLRATRLTKAEGGVR